MTAPATAPPRCFSFIGTRGIRVTLLDSCGRPIYGDGTQAVSDGVVSVECEPEVEEGEDYSQKTASGQECFPAFKGPDSIKWWNLTIEFCLIDPELLLIMNRTWSRVTDYSRTATTGMRMGSKVSDVMGFSLETWPKAAGSGVGAACLDDADSGNLPQDYEPGGYIILPWVIPSAPDSFTLENEPSTLTIQGKTKGGSLWGRGPYNVVRDQNGTAAPLLDPIDPGFDVPKWDLVSTGDPQQIHWELTTVKPPTGKCGAQPLWNQDATPPTIEVAAASDTDKTRAKLTVSNFDQIGKAGTVAWGDGTKQEVPKDSGGVVTKTDPYPDAAMGTEQTVTFTPANGAKPVSKPYTPQKAQQSRTPAVDDQAERDPHTIRLSLTDPPAGEFAVDWGDGAIENHTGTGPFRHTYAADGTYVVVTTDEAGGEVTRDEVTVPTRKKGKS